MLECQKFFVPLPHIIKYYESNSIMTLHIFNPEHDIALASDLACFTAPHAGRQLRHDLAFLPALWAAPSDIIMADDPLAAQHGLERFAQYMRRSLSMHINCERQWLQYGRDTARSHAIKAVDPWGWDRALRARLERCGLEGDALPGDDTLATIRQLSHRNTAAMLLPRLRFEGTVGKSFECRSEEEVDELLNRYGRLVLKAPWSSSGRGIRFAGHTAGGDTQPEEKPDAMTYELRRWLGNILAKQGSVMVEPYYNKVRDMAMEFRSDGRGKVDYLGLSLFHTSNGAYTGNIIATEAAKRAMTARYIQPGLLDEVRDAICREMGPLLNGKYCGPFGVDMMIVHGQQPSLHPCVEINLRRTMGHAALMLTPTDDDICRVMRIEYTGTYALKILKTNSTQAANA